MDAAPLVSAGVLIALSLTGCGSTDSDAGGASAETTVETPWAGFEASASSISLRGDGTSDRQLQLLSVSAGGTHEGLVLSIHPASDGGTVRTSELPNGGELILCHASMDGGRQHSCTPVAGGTTREPIDIRAADAHQGLVLRGTWPEPVVLDEINIEYHAEDDFFAVRVLN